MYSVKYQVKSIYTVTQRDYIKRIVNHSYPAHNPPPAAPTILSPPALLPSAISEYASQYLVGCHATAGTPALAAILCTLSPVSA